MSEPGDYDRAARLGIKLAPEGMLRWAVHHLPDELGFTRWIDTRTIPFPGEADRICDTVAELNHREGLGVSWALIAETQTRPDANFPERVVEYAARFRRELRHGPHGRDRYNVGAVLIQLTGAKPANEVDMVLPGTEVRMVWGFAVMALAEEDALATVKRIEAGELVRPILIWVPLMRGGTDPAVLVEWKRLAEGEADENRRRVYGIVALTFAELTDNPVGWREALEGWGVEKSILWEGIRKQERLDVLRSLLMELLEKWFDPIPGELRDQVQLQANTEVLDRWMRCGMRANSQDEMRAVFTSA